MTPLIATAGGMIGPAAVYLAGAAILGSFAALAHGWAIPTATDIAFSYLIGRLVFGAGHPAVMFLLLLAIADDAGGLRHPRRLLSAGRCSRPPGSSCPSARRSRSGSSPTGCRAGWTATTRRSRARPSSGAGSALWPYAVAGALELVRLPAGGHPPRARPPAGHPGDPARRHRVRHLRGGGGAPARPSQPDRARAEDARSR